MHATRSLSPEEQTLVDPDEHLPFGHFAPTAWQRTLIALARNSFLRRGFFRRAMTDMIRGSGGAPIDVRFRGCAYRLRGRNNLIEFGILLNPDYNADDIDFLAEGCPPGGTFIDIGSNIGLYTLPLAARVGSSGKVIAIDANPLMARRLAWNAEASGLDNIAIFPNAVSDHEGKASLAIRKDDIAIVSVEEDGAGDVAMRTLPSILAEAGVERIDGLKIDIEGHEDRVLAPFIQPCEETLLPRRIVIERPGMGEHQACAAAFLKRGYRAAGQSRNNSFYRRD